MHDTEPKVRPADADELDQLARIWFDGWQESHLHLVPPALIRLRTLPSFHDRLAAALPSIRVVGPPARRWVLHRQG